MDTQSANLNQQFQAAVQQINALPGDKAPALMTDLYGLYKQATDGDHDMPHGEVAADEAEKPSGPAGLSQAQWDSWSKCKGMSLEDAKRQYIDRAAEATGRQPIGSKAGGTAGGGVVTDARTGAPASDTAPGGLQGDIRAGAPYGDEEKLKEKQ